MVEPNLIIVETVEQIRELRQYIKKFDFLFVDSETTGVHLGAEIMGFGICAEDSCSYYVILHRWNKDTKSIDYASKEIMEEATLLIQDLIAKSLVAHNGLFDCAMFFSYFKVLLIQSLHTCTMILAHLLNENRRVGLKELAKELLGHSATKEQEEMKASVIANGGRWTTKEKDMYMADPYLLAKYGAKDPWLTKQVFYKLAIDLHEQQLENFFYHEESMPLLRGPTWDLNTVGLQVDTKALSTLKSTLKAECAEAKSFILNEIAPRIKEVWPGTNKSNTFNLGSNQQLSQLIFGIYKLDYSKLTKAGKTVCKAMNLRLPYAPGARRDFVATCTQRKGSVYSPEGRVNGKTVKAKKVAAPWKYIACDKGTLKKLAPKYKWIERLLEYKKKLKLLDTYVEGIEERIQYGTIRPSFLQHGTTSGRYASRSPNFQNLPRDDKRVKECIVARPGRVFVGADYSQLEPRVFSYFSNDPRLREAFNSDSDFYSVVGIDTYDKFDSLPLKDEHPKAFRTLYPGLRQDTKVFVLASTYGATGGQLGPLMGKSSDEAQHDIDLYFEKFPKVKEMMLESHEMAKTNGQVTNLFGRPRRMPEAKKIVRLFGNLPHSEYPYEVRNLLNLAVNHRIQSTAASIVNRSAIKFYKNKELANIDCRLVLQVHDSLIVECSEADADTVATLLRDAMENTVQLEGIPLEAIPKIGVNIAKV